MQTLSTQLQTARLISVKTALKTKACQDQIARLMVGAIRRNKHNKFCAYRKIHKEWILLVK